MSETPVWSVVIPTRDRPRELATCLRCLAPGTQTLPAAMYEVIVSDDGDFLASESQVRARYPWARHVRGPQRGSAANRNTGAQAATGRWIVFADDDVVPSVGWLAAYATAAGEELVLEGRTTCESGLPSPLYHAPENNTGGVLWSCNFAIRHDLFTALGGFDEGFPFPHMEDADLRQRVLATGTALRWVPEASVDHPPRRQPAALRLGAYRAAEVRFLYKHGAVRPVRWRMMRNLLLSRLVTIRTRPKGIDTVRALGALLVEFTYVFLHAGAWERASAAEFPPRRP